LLYDPEHPGANSKGLIAEHRAVMAQHLGHQLARDENVHHLNGVRSDNRLENLELWVRPQPAGVRTTDAIQYAVSVLMRYAPEMLAPRNDRAV